MPDSKSTAKSWSKIVMVIREQRFRTWKECVEAALAYEKLGIETEVKGWDAMRANKLTIYDDKEFEDK